MFLRIVSVSFALFWMVSCSQEKEAPAPVDKLVGNWSVKEEATYNIFTGMSFDIEPIATVNYKATIKKATTTSITIDTDRTNSPNYDYKGDLTVDWDAKTITGGGTIEGKIIDEKNFTVTYIYMPSPPRIIL
jgi:hypothetical protein